MSEYNFYLVEKKPPIAWVFMNRPEKMNALNYPAWTENITIFEDLEKDQDIWVAIFAGKGPCFSTGLDLIDMVKAVPELVQPGQLGAEKWKFKNKIPPLQDAITCMQRCTWRSRHEQRDCLSNVLFGHTTLEVRQKAIQCKDSQADL